MRRSGKSFRLVLQALKRTSEGECVVVVCHDATWARQMFVNALAMCAPFLQPENIGPEMLKVGEGFIKFSGPISVEETQRLNDLQYEIYYDQA